VYAGSDLRRRSGVCRDSSILHSNNLDQVSSVSHPRLHPLSNLLACLLCLTPLVLAAQTEAVISEDRVRGSVISVQGEAVANVTIEIRDLRGTRVAWGFTDQSGMFKVSTAARPGPYILLAAKGLQVADERKGRRVTP
jgi:hypothetical protein